MKKNRHQRRKDYLKDVDQKAEAGFNFLVWIGALCWSKHAGAEIKNTDTGEKRPLKFDYRSFGVLDVFRNISNLGPLSRGTRDFTEEDFRTYREEFNGVVHFLKGVNLIDGVDCRWDINMDDPEVEHHVEQVLLQWAHMRDQTKASMEMIRGILGETLGS